MEKEEICMLFERLKDAFPVELVDKIHKSGNGYGMILGYLKDKEFATAGELAQVCHVSTARIAVLIDKLINKGYVTKEALISDKRVSIIKITEDGITESNRISNHCLTEISNIVEKLGRDDLNKLIEILTKIRNITKEEI